MNLHTDTTKYTFRDMASKEVQYPIITFQGFRVIFETENYIPEVFQTHGVWFSFFLVPPYSLGSFPLGSFRSNSKETTKAANSLGSWTLNGSPNWKYNQNPKTRWWQLEDFLCSPRILGKWSKLTFAYFSNGLVQPPTRKGSRRKSSFPTIFWPGFYC